MPTSDPAVALIRSRRGLSSELARLLGISKAAVGNWDRVPPKHVCSVAKLLNLHPHSIRPDVFPPPRRAVNRARKS